MYLAHLLNSKCLFQRCASWSKETSYANDLSLVLNRATTAVVGIHRIEELQKRCFFEFDLFSDQFEILEDRIVFHSESMVSIQSEISPILSSLRIIQDLIHKLVRRKTGLDLPRSISDTIKKIDRYKMPNELKELYQRYWELDGSKIRNYRILDQHYGSVLSHTFLLLKPERRVLVVFPDNPSEQSQSKMTYQLETCGISTVRVGFDNLHGFVESIAAYFEYDPSALSDTVAMDQLGDLRPYRKRSLAFLLESKVKQNNEGNLVLDISGIRFDQIESGQLQIQKMIVSDEKLKEINR